MITAFQLSDNTASGPRALLHLFRRNRVRVEYLYCDSVALKSVTYERFRGRVNWTSIDRFIGGSRSKILCREDTLLAAERGYRRFSSDELRRRLCENAALYLLGALRAFDVSVALIDRVGDRIGLCSYLVDYSDKVTVVTEKPQIYLEEADRLMAEKGAVINVRKSVNSLKSADLLISPERISRDLQCAPDAVILSAAEPTVAQNAPVIYDYFFDLPEKYSRIKPVYLDEMYFASALYSLAGAHELGSSVFRRCTDGVTVHTRKSLTLLMQKRLSEPINS